MAWNKERIAMCETCAHEKEIYDDGIHEICSAGICVLCFQTERCECNDYIPIQE